MAWKKRPGAHSTSANLSFLFKGAGAGAPAPDASLVEPIGTSAYGQGGQVSPIQTDPENYGEPVVDPSTGMPVVETLEPSFQEFTPQQIMQQAGGSGFEYGGQTITQPQYVPSYRPKEGTGIRGQQAADTFSLKAYQDTLDNYLGLRNSALGQIASQQNTKISQENAAKIAEKAAQDAVTNEMLRESNLTYSDENVKFVRSLDGYNQRVAEFKAQKAQMEAAHGVAMQPAVETLDKAKTAADTSGARLTDASNQAGLSVGQDLMNQEAEARIQQALNQSRLSQYYSPSPGANTYRVDEKGNLVDPFTAPPRVGAPKEPTGIERLRQQGSQPPPLPTPPGSPLNQPQVQTLQGAGSTTATGFSEQPDGWIKLQDGSMLSPDGKLYKVQ